MNEKSTIQIKAKEINSRQVTKTLALLFFCVFAYLILSNLHILISLIPTNFANFEFLSLFSNIYVKLIISLFLLIVSIPILAKLKAMRETWFIFKSKVNGDLKYKPVKMTVKKVGIKRYTSLYIRLFILNVFWAVVFLIPYAIMVEVLLFAAQQMVATKSITAILIGGNIVFLTLGVVSFLCIRQRYTLCYLILTQRGDLSVRGVIGESTRLMDEKCVDLFLFKLRFTAWILLSVLIFPTTIYVYPYYKHACAVYSLELLASRNKCDDTTLTFKKLKNM